MMHKSISQWRKYVMDELQEQEREVYENHLYTCDQCLELYLQAVAELETDMPTISNETALLDTIMAKVGKEPLTTIHPITEERSQGENRIQLNDEQEEQREKVVSLQNNQKALSIQVNDQADKKVVSMQKQAHVADKYKRNQETNKVISVQKQQQSKKVVVAKTKSQPKQQPFYQSAAFHYLLATAMTLLLMASGVFSSMIDLTSSIEQPKQTEKPSFTEGLLDKTFTWMDEIDEKLKEEPKLKNERKQTKEVGK